MKRPSALLALGMALGLTGCISIGGDTAELQVYAPRVTIEASEDWPRLERSLAIAEPHASAALDSNRIGVRPEPAKLQVYAGAVWSDSAPSLVQAALVDTLGGTGRFQAVVRPTDAVAADLLLRLDLRQFEAVYAEGERLPSAVIELQATLVDQRGAKVLSSRRFRVEKPSEDKRLPAVVEAFEAGLSDLATAMAPWVLEQAQPTRTP